MRIAVVNDLAMCVEVLRRVVAMVPGADLAWIAKDGAEAVEMARRDRPDIILMDLIMPVMDGVEATRRIMLESPCAILVVTATVRGNISKVYEAMGHGALDVIATPVMANAEGCSPLINKIIMIGRLIKSSPVLSADSAADAPSPPASDSNVKLILLGASTGGPQALAEVLGGLTPNPGLAIVVAQHIDAGFAPGLAAWLAGKTGLKVGLALDGGKIEAGAVSLAGRNDHLRIDAGLIARYTPEPEDMPYRPSVDVLFKSAAANFRGRGAAVLLSGMGADGAAGLLALRRAGWRTFAQNQESCVVYGMPKAADRLGAAEEVLPPAAIARRLNEI